MAEADYRSGFVAIAGRPNVGKSTLLNALTGSKVSIVTAKPQTTRCALRGIRTRDDYQIVFVDTPGLQERSRSLLDRTMNRTARHAVDDADIVLLVVTATGLKEADRVLLRSAREGSCVVAVNKIDMVKAKERLLPLLEEISTLAPGVPVVPVSALRSSGLDSLVSVLVDALPAAPMLYPEGIITDQNETFRIAEVIREKLMAALHEEIPYGTAVEIESIEDENGLRRISAVVWVDREPHKAIVIGAGGQKLKAIGRAARLELRDLLGQPVHLSLWARVKKKWSDDAASLRKLGVDLP